MHRKALKYQNGKLHTQVILMAYITIYKPITQHLNKFKFIHIGMSFYLQICSKCVPNKFNKRHE